MKFSINPSTLAALLGDIAKAIPPKPANPILANFLLEAKKESLRVTANDGEISLRGVIKPYTIEEEGRILVPAKLFADMIRTLPEGTSVFSVNENTMNISYATGNTNIPAIDPEGYNTLPVPPKDSKKLYAVSDTLVRGISRTLFAASTKEEHKILNGIFFDITEDSTTMVTTDTARLIIKKSTAPQKQDTGSFVLPSKAAAILKNILPKEQPVLALYNDKSVRFVFGNIELTAITVVGKYPDYKAVVPKENINIITVDTEALQDALQRMHIVSDKSRSFVELTATSGCLELNTRDVNMNTNGNEKINCQYDNEELKVILKTDHLQEVLPNTNSDKINIKIKTKTTPILVEPTEQPQGESYTALMMPYRVN